MPHHVVEKIFRKLNLDSPSNRQRKITLNNQSGTTAVELSIVILLLLTLIFGIIEFSIFLYNKQVLTNASREGARAGVVVRLPRLDNDQIKSVVKAYCQDKLITFGTDTIEDNDIAIKDVGLDVSTQRCVFFGCDLEITIDYTYDFLFLSTIGIGPINLRAITNMKME